MRMDSHQRGRRLAVFAGTLCASVALVVITASPASSGTPAVRLLPDLRTQPPMDLYVDDDELRLSNTVANIGVGALEIYPESSAGSDCDGDGDAANDRFAYQRVFEDSPNAGSLGYFIRNVDTASGSHPVGCMVYHPLHNHWHFEDFAVYSLRSESSRRVARRSVKTSFCVIDTDHVFPGRLGSPFWHYGGDGCNPDSVEGLSIGWADTYSAETQGQSLDISGLPGGNYCLLSRADPANRLEELHDGNNARRTRIFLDPSQQGDVQRLAGPCQRPL